MKEDWKPEVGDTVLYRNRDSLDYAWNEPVEVEVVSIKGAMAWVSGFLKDSTMGDKLVSVKELSPKEPDVDAWEQESRIAGKVCTVLWNTTLTTHQIDEVMKSLMAAGVTFKGEDDDK